MELVVMGVVLKVVDRVLPVGSQDVAVIAMQALTDLFIISIVACNGCDAQGVVITFAHVP